MPLTPAEKSKRYRERLKQDNPEKFKNLQKKNLERAKQSYKTKSTVLTEEQKEERRKKWREFNQRRGEPKTTNMIESVSIVTRKFSSTSDVPKYESFAISVPQPFVFHVELSRPAKLNSFNIAFWRELKECFDALSDNSDCRVVVVSAQGKHFTAGLDFKDVMAWGQEMGPTEDVARRSKFLIKKIGSYQDSISSLETCVKPVLTVVHGACVGAGLNLITAADIRYCTEDAWFQLKEVDLGLAADVGALQRLPKIVGNMSIVRDLCFTARKFQAAEAKDIGLVSKVLPDKESALKAALQVAGEIAKKSPVAVQTTKKSLVYSLSRPNQDGLDHLKLHNMAMLQSEDFINAAMAQATKDEAPEFDKL